MALNNAFGSIVPSQKPQATDGNYLKFDDGSNDFAQQYLPELYKEEIERYGNRTLGGFLKMVGAEMPMSSDQVIWSEQNRLHISYNGVSSNVAGTELTITETADIKNVISKGSTIVVSDPANGLELKCFVSGVAGAVLTVKPYTQADLTSGGAGEPDLSNKTNLKIFVYGSEYGKGTGDSDIVTVDPSFSQFSNSPIIIKEKYGINGSDAGQIGWVEVATESGQSGFLWYLKAESETRLRYEDYLEMSMIEGELAASGSGAEAEGLKGTQGLFAAVRERGNVFSGFSPSLTDFDAILKNLDTQGAIEENMLFLNRSTMLGIDDMLANLSDGAQGGTSYGVFSNSEDMALNLGFSGFRRGSYDFYKTDWKYLNDASTRGAQASSAIDGILVPAGTSTVYDQNLGSNIRRPFLHVRYRASQADDRKMKTWVTGSFNGAATTDLDRMDIHFLSERCLVTQGANNFVLFEG